MKIIIRMDWALQTLLIAIIFTLLVMANFDLAWAFATNLLCWQAISAVTLLVINNGRGPRRRLFLAGIFGYMLSVIASIEIVAITLPVILMICYWLLTTCNLYPSVKYHKGKFLPHTSF